MKNLKYKLIASDFDGTLTGKGSAVPEENMNAIRAYQAAGGMFVVATGRMFPSIMRQLPFLGLNQKGVPLVSYQGALITDSNSGEALFSAAMRRDTVRKIVRFCARQNYYCQFYSFDKVFVKEYCALARGYAEYSEVADCVVVTGGHEAYLDAHPELEVCKVMLIDLNGGIAEKEAKLNEYLNGETVFCRSADVLTECVAGSAGKGSALTWLSEYTGIPIGETLAIGDSMNDESMLKAAGLGVAMANASEELKSAAGYITDTNENAGLAKVIWKILAGEL